ncbi:MAG: bifunctional phosphopantothenoylcysteine decarboxylase/phosphopantothenate--cysteine ligase CoaBC [Actinomycetota bacterium]
MSASSRRPGPVPDGRSALSGRRILVGVTGGIAAYKACSLARLLTTAGATVQVVMTTSALRFVGEATFAALSGRPVRTDVFEDPERVVHVRMAHEADLAVVAPATANSIAKLASGIADDLLTSTLLEATCPLVIAPAMHTGMYENEATQANIRELSRRGVEFVGPVAGSLAAGDEGLGRMAEPEDILARLEDLARRGRDLAGWRILVTAGPTHEPIDPVRFIGNRSTGRMGFVIAEEARVRGADVVLVTGPVSLPDPDGVRVVHVETAQQMRDAVLAEAGDVDVVVKAAAVADFRPAVQSDRKIKKSWGVPEIRLEPTPDVLRELGERSERGDRPVLVGFAAETNDLEEAGRRKLAEKHLDLIVVNEVGREGTGFGSETNDAMILSPAGDDAALRTWTKRELAGAILDQVRKILASRG